MAEQGTQTSLKQLFQGMQVTEMTLVEGVVTNSSPLTVKLKNDNLELNQNVLTVPCQLSDYQVGCDLSALAKSINATPAISKLVISGGVLTIHNGLQKGDTVILLSYNSGKKYYVLDRVV